MIKMHLILKLLRYATYLLLALIVLVLLIVYLNDHTVREIRIDEYAKQDELDQLVQKAKGTGLNHEEEERLDFLLEEQQQHIEHEFKKKLEQR